MTTLAVNEFRIHPSHQIHHEMPSGFTLASILQVREYEATGYVNGAAKVCFFWCDETDETYLVLRLRPPRTFDDIISPLGRTAVRPLVLEHGSMAARDEYVRQYNAGHLSGRRGNSTQWGTGLTNFAWDDGYLDAVAQRAKWHLTYCTDHDECGEA